MIVDKRDQGILDLLDYSTGTGVNVPKTDIQIVSSYDEILIAANDAKSCSNPTICFESLVGIQSLCDDHTLMKDYDNRPGLFANYRNGEATSANTYFQRLLDVMVSLQNMGKNVILTGHSKVGTAKNISGEDWVSQVTESCPALARRVDATIANIFHIGSITSTVKPASKVRAVGMSTMLYTTVNPHFPAKNRMGLLDPIPYECSAAEMYQTLCPIFNINPKTGIRL